MTQCNEDNDKCLVYTASFNAWCRGHRGNKHCLSKSGVCETRSRYTQVNNVTKWQHTARSCKQFLRNRGDGGIQIISVKGVSKYLLILNLQMDELGVTYPGQVHANTHNQQSSKIRKLPRCSPTKTGRSRPAPYLPKKENLRRTRYI